MTVSKITSPPNAQEQIDKINEIIDNLGGGGGGGSVDIDNITITKNLSDEIQTVAVKDDRSGNAIKTWTGTEAQYNSLVAGGTVDNNTLYNITDDALISLSIFNSLYPVGSIYIGTMQACPLESLGIGTWQLVASDRVLQGAGLRGNVGNTVNESLPNITGSIAPGAMSSHWNSSDVVDYKSRFIGAFTATGTDSQGGAPWSAGQICTGLDFDASRCSSTYQNNAPVQQNAYLVNIWERIS